MITIGIAAVGIAAALLVGRSCATGGPRGGQAGAAGSSAQALDPAADEVNAGLAAADASDAVAHFRKALALNPSHYGATYQLARALDRAGKRDEARQQWERVLRLAEQAGDQPLVETARTRLGTPAAAPGDPMTAGLDALYKRHDPATAAARFREVLAQSPEHYGATFQLATALDQAGDARASRPVWERMLKLAEAIRDEKTAEAARARLAEIDKIPGLKPEIDPEAEAMSAAVETLYTKHDPAGAAVLFRKILARNPEHYGATFQLATTLDQAKKPAEARPLWEKVLKMAAAVQDSKTEGAARARLAQKQP